MSKSISTISLLLLLFVFSCKSTPAPAATDPEILTPLTFPDAEDTAPEDANTAPPEITDDLPTEFLQEGDGADDDGDAAPLEEPPSLDLPETTMPPLPSEEDASALALLPDVPAPPVQEPEPAALPAAPVTPPVQESVPAPKPAEQPKASPQEPPAEVKGRSSPPAPPSFLRIPEPENPPPVREITPITPLPELPARTPPVVLPGTPAEAEGRVPPPAELVFSRTVRATVGQLVEIPYRGTGWVYLGELGSRRGLSYDSRRLDMEGQSFVFRAEAVGTYALKFYRQDFIRDYIVNDHVQVIVGEAPDSTGISWSNPVVDRGRVIAEPRWPTIENGPSGTTPAPVPASPETPAPAPGPVIIDDSIAPVPQAAALGAPAQDMPPELPGTVLPDGKDPSAQEESLSPADYVTRARQEYDAGRVDSALSILDQVKQQYTALSDEALWLYGQLLEANSPNRDIRLALEYYRRLIREYPQSPRVPEAQQRVSYLERYYFNLR